MVSVPGVFLVLISYCPANFAINRSLGSVVGYLWMGVRPVFAKVEI